MIRIKAKGVKASKAKTVALKAGVVSRETAGSSKAAGRTVSPPEMTVEEAERKLTSILDRTGQGKTREPAPPVTEEGEGTRLVFPCSSLLSGRLDAYWHGERLGSKSAAIRALLEDALKRWEKGRLE